MFTKIRMVSRIALNAYPPNLFEHPKKKQPPFLKKINCIPSYWLEMIQEGLELQECTSPKELRMAYQYSENWQEVMEGHDRPCIDMFNIFHTKSDPNHRKFTKKS